MLYHAENACYIGYRVVEFLCHLDEKVAVVNQKNDHGRMTARMSELTGLSRRLWESVWPDMNSAHSLNEWSHNYGSECKFPLNKGS